MAGAVEPPARRRQNGKRGCTTEADSHDNKRCCPGDTCSSETEDAEEMGWQLAAAIVKADAHEISHLLNSFGPEMAGQVLQLRYTEYSIPMMLLVAYRTSTPLSAAQINEFKEMAADPLATDIDGNSLLHLLLRRGRMGEFEALLARIGEKAFSWVRTLLDATNDEGRNPLHLAALHNQPKALDIMLEAGLDVNQPTLNTQLTALHFAVMNKHTEVIKRLLKCKDIDVNTLTIGNQTALDFLPENEENKELITLLSRHQAIRGRQNDSIHEEEIEDDEEDERETEKSESESESDNDEEYRIEYREPESENEDDSLQRSANRIVGC